MTRHSGVHTQIHLLAPYPLRNRTHLKNFISSIFKKEQRTLGNLDLIFCSDAYLVQINQDFLGHNDLTDVITFDLSDELESSAEIYISVDRVRENAKTFGVSVENELHRVIFHGVLHLCGYKDKKPRDIKMIRSKENEYLQKYFG